jgi:hypothetical protein
VDFYDGSAQVNMARSSVEVALRHGHALQHRAETCLKETYTGLLSLACLQNPCGKNLKDTQGPGMLPCGFGDAEQFL